VVARFSVQLSFCFVIKGIKFWIYHNYTNFFHKSNIYIYIISCSMKQIKIHFSSFLKGLHIYNKEIYKTPKHLKENTFEFFCLLTTHKIFLHEKT